MAKSSLCYVCGYMLPVVSRSGAPKS